jgi:hypothetical protein
VARAGDVDEYDEDDEALRWAGDDEQGRAAPRLREPEPDTVDGDETEPEEAPGSRGRTVATIAFVVPYLAIAVGWIFAVQQLSSGSASLFGEILWQFGEFLAMLVAPLWFAATLTLTRESRPLVRVGWLALGLGVLVPWPLVLRFLAALEFAGSYS